MQPESVHVIYRNDSDGYTYSAMVAVGMFLTKEAAETALLELIELAQKHTEIRKKYEALRKDINNEIREAVVSKQKEKRIPVTDKRALKHKTKEKIDNTVDILIQKLHDLSEQEMKEISEYDYCNMSDDIENYSIIEKPFGKILWEE